MRFDFTMSILGNIFFFPGFAWAGAALVGIPILIHILNRRRYKIVLWAAMEYLLQAMRKNRRRLKFEQWLLLLTRCTLLLLLGCALARPLGCDRDALARLTGQRNGLHVIVIDNSYSMSYEAPRHEARTHLDQAKLMARTIIGRMNSGSEAVILITAGAPATAVIAEPSYNLEACRSAVERIEQSYGGTDLKGALELALQLVKDKAGQGRKTLDLLTDGAQGAWKGKAAEGLKELGPMLGNAFKVTHYNLGKPGQWNQAVLDISSDTNLITTKFATDFMADVKAYGAGPNPTLQWKLDGAVIGGGGIVPLDKETQPQRLSNQTFKTGGPCVLEAELSGTDMLRIDNTRRRVIQVVSELKVLIIEGQRGMEGLSGSGAFLNLALAPTGDDRDQHSTTQPSAGGQAPSNSYVSPEVISDLEFGNKVLNEYSAVVLTNVASLTEPQAQRLETFVKQGGSLLIFMGDQVNKDNYNSMLLARKADGAERRLLPGKLIKLLSSDEHPFVFDFNPNGILHAYLSDFRGVEKSGLDTAQVYKYWQVELDPAANAERVLDYVSGGSAVAAATAPAARVLKDPAVTVQEVGSGRVVFYSTTANADWTSFPAKPAYPALMHALLSGSVSSGDKWMNLTVGDVLRLPPSLAVSAAPTLVDPQNRAIAVDPGTGKDGQTIFQSPPLTKPGIYWLSLGSSKKPIAVNVPAVEEADVRTLTSDKIKDALGISDMLLEGDAVPPEGSFRDDSSDYGWLIMCAVLALAGAECFMAMQFGHYRRHKT